MPLELGSHDGDRVFARASDDGYRETIAHRDGSASRVVRQQPPPWRGSMRSTAARTVWTVGVIGAGNPIALRNR